MLLIDTAGRMQDNTPLMQALSKLIAVNKPDTVLFVGEALVGNDAVDQVTKFNRCLADLDQSSVPRLIDGLVLTKFDTIDDKVRATPPPSSSLLSCSSALSTHSIRVSFGDRSALPFR